MEVEVEVCVCVGGGLYEMVIRADRRRDGGRSPSRAGDEAAPTWRCVISLKPNWYMPINPKALVIWNYYTRAYAHTCTQNFPPLKSVISTAKSSQNGENSNKYCNEK